MNHKLYRTEEELQTAVEFNMGSRLTLELTRYKHKKKKKPVFFSVQIL